MAFDISMIKATYKRLASRAMPTLAAAEVHKRPVGLPVHDLPQLVDHRGDDRRHRGFASGPSPEGDGAHVVEPRL